MSNFSGFPSKASIAPPKTGLDSMNLNAFFDGYNFNFTPFTLSETVILSFRKPTFSLPAS